MSEGWSKKALCWNLWKSLWEIRNLVRQTRNPFEKWEISYANVEVIHPSLFLERKIKNSPKKFVIVPLFSLFCSCKRNQIPRSQISSNHIPISIQTDFIKIFLVKTPKLGWYKLKPYSSLFSCQDSIKIFSIFPSF